MSKTRLALSERKAFKVKKNKKNNRVKNIFTFMNLLRLIIADIKNTIADIIQTDNELSKKNLNGRVNSEINMYIEKQ
ncbi:hypothetical protein [Proteus terrae]|uniref:hypothetical protein n=1 Tax=Proteus terrae TaxID=1574161 RepID=UPI0013308632|nr:hypothetical protein [Proteus terrae]QKD70338.1 hypothetical protein HG541_13605 [Proteus terrae subsp. cibarius]QKD72166.1 hypothetical protein HG539_04590 [Proteus terrae subsp. cibarius]UDF26759.1 hypothetical protein LHA39_04260 [Proteus terrae subsp. cibarius]